jgi:CNT family concentrative nucleoside transporter
MHALPALLGLGVFLGIAWAASTDRKAVSWRTVAWGLGLQLIFALAILKTPPGDALFRWISAAFSKLIAFSDAGGSFVWGWLYRKSVPPPFLVDVLMTIVFFASLVSVLYHLGILQLVVSALARLMQKTMRTSGAETLSAAANVFVGQTEAPLVVKPYLETMTMSELHAVMVGGFATIAGGVLAVYVGFGFDAGHLVAASFMSAPAALVAAKLFHPETGRPATAGEVRIRYEKTTVNVLDAACGGAADGMKLVLNVLAMLAAFVSLVAMLNWGIGKLTGGLSLERILGWLFAPVAWLMGVPWGDCGKIGGLLGLRMVLNEFIAFDRLKDLDVSARAHVVATYAFCGFANLGSIAIQIGGLATIAPSRRGDLARLGLRAMLAGTLASFLTAGIAGILLGDEQVERDFRKGRGRAAASDEAARREYEAFLSKYPASPWAEEFRKLSADPSKRR